MTHFTLLPGAPLVELVDAHVRRVADWLGTSGCRPMVFGEVDAHALTAYGVASHMREVENGLLWMANPYVDQPLPPLPGRAWESREFEPSGVA